MTTPATDEQIAELEGLFEDTRFSSDPDPHVYFAIKINEYLPAIIARLRAAEAEAERIRADEREKAERIVWNYVADAERECDGETAALLKSVARTIRTQGDPNANK